VQKRGKTVTATDLKTFRKLANATGLGYSKKVQLPHIEHCKIFSPPVIGEFHKWLCQAEWTIAFQLEIMVHRLALTVQEALSLQDCISLLSQKEGLRYTTSLLQAFAKGLESYADTSDGIKQFFDCCVLDFNKNGKVSALDCIPKGLFYCCHIDVHHQCPLFLNNSNSDLMNR
jgi:hypothetical protein